jgi:Cd2+/Zn2+-exporting ATPase
MSRKIVRELLLEGLDCAHCASKIEAKVSSISAVESASMNFITKTLSIEVENKDFLDEVLEEARKIINNLEPHVVVSEKKIDKQEKRTLILMGLDCANCANKIEGQVKSLSGVSAASMNFANRKLTMEISNKHEAAAIIEEVKRIIRKIEPDVEVIEEGSINKPVTGTFIMEGLG